MTKKLRTYSD